MVIGNPLKTIEKSTFAATWKASARKRSDAPPCGAPRNHNAIPWKSLENHRFLHVRADCIRCILLRPSAPHGKSYGYWKTLENQWANMVSWPCRSKIKNNPPTDTFPGKERFQNISFGNQWETLEIIEETWFPCLVGPKLKTVPYGSIFWQRAIPKKDKP